MKYARDYLTPREGHTLRWWRSHHPSWVVYRCDRKTPAYSFGVKNVPLDITNRGVRAYLFAKAAQYLREGFGGVAFDNIDFYNFERRCGVWRHHGWHSLGYTNSHDDRRLVHDILFWARVMRAKIKRHFPSAEMTANYSVVPWEPYKPFLELAKYVDLNWDEQGITQNARTLLDGSAWLQKMRYLQYLNAHDVHFMLTNVTTASTDASVPSRVLWYCIASYLMVSDNGDYMYVYPKGPRGYGSFYDRRAYHLRVGDPSGGFYAYQGVWARNFTNGLALVNSTRTTEDVALPRPYYDPNGKLVTHLSLGGDSGTVLRDVLSTG